MSDRRKCHDCGNWIGGGIGHADNCEAAYNGETPDLDELEFVPVVEAPVLREVVEQWRKTADKREQQRRKWTGDKEHLHYLKGSVAAWRECANQLEKVLPDD